METYQKPRKMQELETVLLELNTVRKNAKVYKQQRNSNIFFLSDINTLKTETQKELHDFQSGAAVLEKQHNGIENI